MFDRLGDTIVAVSTPAGCGMRGVVRLSGGRAMEIAAALFRADSVTELGDVRRNVRLCGRAAVLPGVYTLPAELFIFRKPRSYTREDVAEVHTVGAAAALTALVERALEGGAREAEPGEFTARAFYHGALDLAAVEGIAELIHARTDVQLRAAREWLDGNLAGQLQSIRTRLVEFLTLVEAEIDFTEEQIRFVDPVELLHEVQAMVRELDDLVQQARLAERVNQTPRVMLIGRPNTGKSTLMNRLTGMDRSVCSPVAGTTRDLLTAVANLPGGQIELMDTAGMGENPQELELLARGMMSRELVHADLVCHIVDLSDPRLMDGELELSWREGTPVMWVGNKCDAVTEQVIEVVRREVYEAAHASLRVISAARGDGIEDLVGAMSQALFCDSQLVAHQRVTISRRHREALCGARAALGRIAERGASRVMADVEWTASDVRCAVSELDAIFGEVTAEDVLREIFSRFCIGK